MDAGMNRSDVAILMGTYEGPEFFGRQLESIIAQTVTGWKLWISDDSSSPAMRNVLREHADALAGRVQCDDGPRRGFVANFLHLICRPDIDARYYALSDQDDIWDSDKLERALEWLETVPASVPALYCGRVRLVDRDEQLLGMSPCFTRPPDFRNALVQSIAGGNTMVFNAAARQFLVKAGADVDVVVHDWWIYLVVTGCGGRVRYDECPSLSYRQHEGNIIGGNFTWRAMVDRVVRALGGRQQAWHDRNMRALMRLMDSLSPAHRACLAVFEDGRKRWLVPRLLGLFRAGVYRQTWRGSVSLYLLALLGRV